MKKRKALFLDRDGVINEDSGYVYQIDDFQFLPGVFAALRQARRQDYVLIVVTNQSGIGRGHYSEAQFHSLTRWMTAQLLEEEIEIAGVYFDPTHPTDAIGSYKRVSPDRKPAPGMILKAAADHNIDLAASAIIGDRESDIEAGIAAGIGTTIRITDKKSSATFAVLSIDQAMEILEKL